MALAGAFSSLQGQARKPTGQGTTNYSRTTASTYGARNAQKRVDIDTLREFYVARHQKNFANKAEGGITLLVNVM